MKIRMKIKLPYHRLLAAWRSPTRAWIETAIITLLALAASLYFHSSDPLFIRSNFPWLWLIPALIALQYRFLPALFSLACIILAFIYQYSLQGLSDYGYKMFLFGGITLTLICCQFSAIWYNRIRKAEETNFYTSQRISRLINDFYALRYSHDCLEQAMMMNPITLREAMQSIRRLLIDNDDKLTTEIAEKFIMLLASHFTFTKGQLYLYNNDKINPEAIAAIGEKLPLKLDDILIKKTIDNKQANYFAISQIDKESHSDYLAAVPLKNFEQKMLGLLVIEEIPFLSLNHETLTILSVLMSYFANEMWASENSDNMLKQYRNCPPQFAMDIIRMQHLYQETDLDSVLLAFYFAKFEQRKEVIEIIRKHQRSLDQFWDFRIDVKADTCIMLVLMPFTDEQGIHAYLERKRRELKEIFNIDLGISDVTFNYRLIRNNDIQQLIDKLTQVPLAKEK